MTSINIKFSAGSTDKLKNAIVRSLKAKTKNAIDTYKESVRQKVQDIIRQSLYDHPAYTSVVYGKLRGEFGLTDPEEKMANIIDYIVTYGLKINVEINKEKTLIKGKATISFNINYNKLFSREDAYQLTFKRNKPSFVLPWLYWFLASGGQQVIEGYFVTDESPILGRSGLPYAMIPAKGGRGIFKKVQISGSNYSPGDTTGGEYIGDVNNNYITESIISVKNKIQALLRRELKKSVFGAFK